ncbi:hypothetical protein HCH_03640 [Hahella chejuensis KCTC 2396]|uniref:Uncharacterized protein n=1 Tax=Hahella chejuensis (strain KCTC 2396) TaxID=349521 RepID=Q2SG44_HAHCH|nr:hypothetical protein HCH_03640 [Hahella chejuensis KCTC 2396]
MDICNRPTSSRYTNRESERFLYQSLTIHISQNFHAFLAPFAITVNNLSLPIISNYRRYAMAENSDHAIFYGEFVLFVTK